MKFSVITVNWNNANGLEKTICSVEKQNNKLYEFIIIDGGSTDESLDIIRMHKINIHFYLSEKDNGIYDAMNKGVNVASGEYLIFMNSGDYFYSSSVLENISNKDFKNDFIFGGICYRNKHFRYEMTLPKKLCLYDFIEGLCHQGTFIKRTSFLELGGYDISLKIVADWSMLMNAIWRKHYSFVTCKDVIAYYDITGISGQEKSKKVIAEEKEKILEAFNIKFNYFKYKLHRYCVRILRIRLFYKFSR